MNLSEMVILLLPTQCPRIGDFKPVVIPIYWLKIKCSIIFSSNILFIAQPIKNLFKMLEDVVISSKYLAHYGLIFTIQLQRLLST